MADSPPRKSTSPPPSFGRRKSIRHVAHQGRPGALLAEALANHSTAASSSGDMAVSIPLKPAPGIVPLSAEHCAALASYPRGPPQHGLLPPREQSPLGRQLRIQASPRALEGSAGYVAPDKSEAADDHKAGGWSRLRRRRSSSRHPLVVITGTTGAQTWQLGNYGAEISHASGAASSSSRPPKSGESSRTQKDVFREAAEKEKNSRYMKHGRRFSESDASSYTKRFGSCDTAPGSPYPRKVYTMRRASWSTSTPTPSPLPGRRAGAHRRKSSDREDIREGLLRLVKRQFSSRRKSLRRGRADSVHSRHASSRGSSVTVPAAPLDVAAIKRLFGDMQRKPEDESSFKHVSQRLEERCVEGNMQLHDFLLFKIGLQSNCFFMSVTDADAFELARRGSLQRFAPGEEVHCLGEAGTHFFVVRSGEFAAVMEEECQPRVVRPGDSFGEISLLHDVPRWATVKCVSGGSLWAVAREDCLQTVRHIARNSFNENMKLLDRVELFNFLDTAEKKELCEHLIVQIFSPGAIIMQESDSSPCTDCVFVVKSGSLDVCIRGRQVRFLVPGDYIGERRLLYGDARSATVTAGNRSELLRFDRTLLQKVLGAQYYPALFHNVMLIGLKTSDSFSQFSIDVLQQFVSLMVIQDHGPHSTPVSEETGGMRLLIVLDGEVLVTERGAEKGQILRRGASFAVDPGNDSFGVENLTDEPCKLAILSTDAIKSIMTQSDVEEVLSVNQKMFMLRKVYIFRHLSEHHCSLIARSVRMINAVKDEDVIKEGEFGTQFFVIKSGELLVSINGRKLRTIGKSDYFGERGLLFDEARSATVTCSSTKSTLMVIEKRVFMSVIEGGIMIDHIKERIILQNQVVALEDLEESKILGCGSFGVVKLVEHKKSGTQYALKCISRKQAIENQQQEALAAEREILLENDHPFIVKVVRTFKDMRYLYFLTEVAQGGELYDAIRAIGILSHKQAQFYTGSLLLAMENLHERNIAYRDLKPENVLLDAQGYVKLIDFGIAIKLKGLAQTLIGTPHYMAPEVILGNGYGTSCDVWSLGVCTYEFMCGPQPFASDSEDHLEVFREILVGRLVFPAHIKERCIVGFLRNLMRRAVDQRLGCAPTNSWYKVREHEFFQSFDWGQLLSRSLEPPILPDPPDEENVADENAEDFEASAFEAKEVPIEEDGWDKDF